MKLIDADALLKQITEDSRGKEGWYGDTWEFINTIKNAPTIDAVPVVRCKDCVNAQYDEQVDLWYCNYMEVDPDEYCADGERREA